MLIALTFTGRTLTLILTLALTVTLTLSLTLTLTLSLIITITFHFLCLMGPFSLLFCVLSFFIFLALTLASPGPRHNPNHDTKP